MGTIFAEFDSSLVASALGLAMFAAWAFGRWHGQRLRVGTGDVPVSKFEDASLALLGLLLGFTFSMAIAKHDQRRLMVVADSNAIREYTKLRSELTGRRIDEATVESALGQMRLMQDQMTSLVYQALEDGTPIAVALTN